MLVETINTCEIGSQLMIYEVKPNSLLMNQYPNMVVIPVIYITPKQTDTIGPFVIIKLSTESIFPSKLKF